MLDEGILKKLGFKLKKEPLRSFQNLTELLKSQTAPQPKKGTVIIALKYKGGILMAADRRSTLGFSIYTDDEIKIEKISDSDSFPSLLGCAGDVGCIQDLVKQLRCEISEYEDLLESELDVPAHAHILQKIMRVNFDPLLSVLGYVAEPIIAGFDFDGNSLIYVHDSSGSKIERPHYATSGCGWGDARTALAMKWKRNMKLQEAIDLAVEGLFYSGLSSAGVSNPVLSGGVIKTLSRDGVIKDIPEDDIIKIAESLFQDYNRRHNGKGGL